MDLLVLLSVARVLDDDLRGGIVRDFRLDAARRYRLIAEREGRASSLVFSLDPEEPWVGRSVERSGRPRTRPDPFAGTLAKALDGAILEKVSAPSFDRVLLLSFSGGRRLVAELARSRPNLVLLDAEGRVVLAARTPRGTAARISPGNPYRFPPPPRRKHVPDPAQAAAIDEAVASVLEDGASPADAVRRAVFGFEGIAAELVAEEASRAGVSIGTAIVERLERLRRGGDVPVVESATRRLLPWTPAGADPARFDRGADPSATVGAFYAAAERERWSRDRLHALRAILRRESERAEAAAERAREDAERFRDPERFRVWGEALLAGLTAARREGEDAIVPDPYGDGRAKIRVPAPRERSLREAAEDHFRAAKRSRRGRERAEARVRALSSRRARLDAIPAETEDAEALAEAMRREGIPVDLLPKPSRRNPAPRPAPPRLEGVRLGTSRDGWTILVGKSGRENDRLTFKIAGPEDFWLHAREAAGAHVVIRNPGGAKRPPEATLEEAAAAAAWYSEARGHGAADVQWTRRKHVRRARGAPPGTVLVKRSEVLRVRPAPLRADEGASASG